MRLRLLVCDCRALRPGQRADALARARDRAAIASVFAIVRVAGATADERHVTTLAKVVIL